MKGISFATEYKQANNIHRARQKEPRLQITKKCMPFARVNAICRFPANPHKRIDMPLSYLVSGQRTAFRFAVASSPHMSLETDPANRYVAASCAACFGDH